MTQAETSLPKLIPAVEGLQHALVEMTFPLRLTETAHAAAMRQELLEQLQDYVLPRLRYMDAPLLAVIGGSTGAGKSTLVNSVIGAEVSRSGVIRPTTTSPVLVHHPEDEHWFSDRRILPGLARVTGQVGEEPQPGTVRLVGSTTLPPGMGLLDAPDIDSVVDANRALADQLLNAADLWLFVTTAARYADAIPWDLLRRAHERGTAVAIILDRIDPEVIDEVRPHLIDMLREQGLGVSPVFTIPETKLRADGLLPVEAFDRLRAWLEALASDRRAREVVVYQTLEGALVSLEDRADAVLDASRVQTEAISSLDGACQGAYAAARAAVHEGVVDGSLLRGEVLARWQELIGTGEFFRQVEARVSKMRDRLTAAVKGTPPPVENVGEALQSGVAALVQAHAQAAVSDISRAWRTLPGGAALLTDQPELAKPAPDLQERVDRLVRGWQGDLLDLIRSESGNRRTNARIAAYGVNGIGLFLMLLVFTHTAGLSGAEVGIAAGTTALAQKVLEAIFGDQAVRSMAAKARTMLLERVEALYAEEQARHTAAIGSVAQVDAQAGALKAAIAEVKENT
ncbi:MAG: dynamin family protein [Nostocoides sp.]